MDSPFQREAGRDDEGAATPGPGRLTRPCGRNGDPMHMGANARRASFIPDFAGLAAKFVRSGHACAEKASVRAASMIGWDDPGHIERALGTGTMCVFQAGWCDRRIGRLVGPAGFVLRAVFPLFFNTLRQPRSRFYRSN